MKKMILATIAFAVTALGTIAGPLDVKEIKLSNGMTVLLNEDHSQPLVFGAVVVRAGAADTPDEGIAHYFEHIMFKGTDELGTSDYSAEKPMLDSISACYDRLSQATDAQTREAIQREINRLNIAASEYAIPNEFSRLINLYGGTGLNAGTGFDETMYYNTFSPEYMPQWLELNSHRLLNPVFRLFQGELEAVYEEKNMYSDDPMSSAFESIQKAWFGENPYAYPIIGSTENLKNPRMSKMEEFYKKYYVGNNMALVLSGDFTEADVLPYLESTFGRIPAGDPEALAKDAADYSTPKHSGETVKVNIPIPMVSLFALMFDYPAAGHPDEGAMEIAMSLLSNESETGLLDDLVTDNKALALTAMPLQFNKAGAMVCLAIPNLLSKSKKLENLIWEKFDALKAGDFSDETFKAIRDNLVDNRRRDLETIDSRGGLIVDTWCRGKNWEQYLEEIDRIQHITRDDVVAAAQRYISTDNFMRVEKKFGSPERDKLSQPGYEPVTPKRDPGESEYAKRLAADYPSPEFKPRLIDLKTDAVKTPLADHATLYTVANPIDSLFSLSVTFYRGTATDPIIDPLSGLFEKIGTQNLSRKDFNDSLMNVRASFGVSSNKDSFTFTLYGHDSRFDEALGLLADMINNPKADKESFDDVLSAVQLGDESFETNNTNVLLAIVDWLRYSDRSPYLTRVTKKQLKKLKPEQLLSYFDKVKQTEMTAAYSGTLDAASVAEKLRKMLPVDQPSEPMPDTFKPLNPLPTDHNSDQPLIYFYNLKGARQALVATYGIVPAEPTRLGRETAALWADYFGGDMSSVMFQELREYRSLGYYCGESTSYPSFLRHKDQPGTQLMLVGTQADKALIALDALNSIVDDMPLSPSNFESIKSSSLNEVNHSFPTFRSMAPTVARLNTVGWTESPTAAKVEILPTLTLNDIAAYHTAKIKPLRRVYIVIGDKKSIDMKALARLGKIIMLSPKQIYRKK